MQNILPSILLSKNIKTTVYIAINFPVVYGCETWFVTSWGKHKLMAFENRVLKQIFVPKWEEWELRKLHNEGLYDLYSSPNIIRIIR